MIASILASTILMANEATAYAIPSAKAAAPSEHVANRPWYIKAASDQIVNMCFWGGMGSGSGGYTTAGGAAGAGAASTVSFSEAYTQTFETDTATTFYTTISGDVVTIYTSPDLATTTLQTTGTVVTDVAPTDDADAAAASDDSSATDSNSIAATPLTTTLSASPEESVPHGLVADVKAIESYAHALAEAIIAPSSMTALLEDAYNAIMEHGYIHGTKAVELVQQASGALKQLETDPAYRNQRNNLKSQATPAHFNVKNIISTISHTHSAGLAKMTSVPEGKHAIHAAKQIGEEFIREFAN